MRYIAKIKILIKHNRRLKWVHEGVEVDATTGDQAAKAGASAVAAKYPGFKRVQCSGVKPAPMPVTVHIVTKDDLAAPKLTLKARVA